MFETGRRTIFDVCRGHIGHSIDMLEIQEEGVVKGIKVYCNTCRTVLLQQETQDYDIRTEIATRKSRRVGAMNYDQWENQFYREFQQEHDGMCDCDNYQDCESGEMPMYEGSELTELYEDYLKTFERPAPQQTQGWEESTTPTPEPWDTQSTGCVNDTGWDTSDREWTT